MTFGMRLQDNFQSNAKERMCEVELFKCLIDSFKNTHGKNKVYNFHGKTHQVRFNSKGGDVLERELCDLAIISYSVIKRDVRITFLQNKKQLDYLKTRTFSVDIGQLDLLSNRPDIFKVNNSFNPHTKLLSEALLASIGTYGVFYSERSKVHMYYSIAELLEKVTPNAKGKNLKVKSKAINNCVRLVFTNYGLFDELEACETISDFGEGLLQMKIGSPMQFFSDKGKAVIFSWITSINRLNEENNVLADLLDTLVSYNEILLEDSNYYMNDISLLVINVD